MRRQDTRRCALCEVPHGKQTQVQTRPWPEYEAEVSRRQSRYLGSKYQACAPQNCREKRAKEKCYLGEVKRVMALAELAGLLTNK